MLLPRTVASDRSLWTIQVKLIHMYCVSFLCSTVHSFVITFTFSLSWWLHCAALCNTLYVHAHISLSIHIRKAHDRRCTFSSCTVGTIVHLLSIESILHTILCSRSNRLSHTGSRLCIPVHLQYACLLNMAINCKGIQWSRSSPLAPLCFRGYVQAKWSWKFHVWSSWNRCSFCSCYVCKIPCRTIAIQMTEYARMLYDKESRPTTTVSSTRACAVVTTQLLPHSLCQFFLHTIPSSAVWCEVCWVDLQNLWICQQATLSCIFHEVGAL